jgi:hypothetical protein
MPLRKSSLCIVTALLCSTCWAAERSPDQDAMLFMESVAAPVRAQRCAKDLPDHLARFAPLHAQWLRRNASRIAAGKSFLEADAASAGKSFAGFVRALEDTTLLGMQQMSAADLKAFCEATLSLLSE